MALPPLRSTLQLPPSPPVLPPVPLLCSQRAFCARRVPTSCSSSAFCSWSRVIRRHWSRVLSPCVSAASLIPPPFQTTSKKKKREGGRKRKREKAETRHCLWDAIEKKEDEEQAHRSD